MKRIAILNGPNLDRLGKREPEIYGSTTLAGLEAKLTTDFADQAELTFFQSNHEGALVDHISALAEDGIQGIVINGAALTHTSVALRDALLGSQLRAVEVHISNIYRREEFRHKSLTGPACEGIITGLGLEGYSAAVRYLLLD